MLHPSFSKTLTQGLYVMNIYIGLTELLLGAGPTIPTLHAASTTLSQGCGLKIFIKDKT